MTAGEMLQILKGDLQMITDSNDTYLETLLDASRKFIEREGIKLKDDIDCNLVVVHYAAYLFRKRASPESAMPRFLRFELNSLLLSQKGSDDIDV